MEINQESFIKIKEKVEKLYLDKKEIYCPYFQKRIILNSDGFHHLQFSSRRERNKNEQFLKFRLTPLALKIIEKSGTIQEYRKILMPVGKKSKKDGFVKMKEVEFWGLVAIMGEKSKKIKTILRRVGDGNIIFWSVMPYSKIKNGEQKIFTEGIEED
ncbi:MAG: hypothetical protein WC822_00295 [Candidatus Paceibacterota bacterium]|jgi:hypothetical protein